MLGKWVLSLILIFPLAAFAESVQFPKGCPADNLSQVCSTLEKIGNDKILVFADGTQLPACYTKTADESSRKEHLEAENQLRSALLRSVAKSKFQRTDNLSESQLNEVNNAVGMVWNLTSSAEEMKQLPGIGSDPEAISAIDQFIKMKSKVRPPKAFRGKDINDDANFAANQIAKLAASLAPKGNPLRENIISKMAGIHVNSMRTDRPIHCRPYINAFYMPNPGQQEGDLGMSPGLSYFPPAVRMQTLGHEIAHSFDPCAQKIEKDSPLAPFLDCVQNKIGGFRRSLFLGACDPHTQEAFCDYFGLYVLEEWEKFKPQKKVEMPPMQPNMVLMPPGFENIFLHLDIACSTSEGKENESTHPHSSRRLQDILLKSPTIAKSLGCPSGPDTYRCDIKNGTLGTPPQGVQKAWEFFKRAIR